MWLRRSPLVLSVLVLFGCEDATGPLHLSPDLPVSAISDAGTDGNAGFYFLAPMVKGRSFSGAFDGALSPIVEVCETAACNALHASFTTNTGPGSQTVRVDGGSEHYIVNWHTGRTGAVAGRPYRIQVRVGDLVLGYADVRLASKGKGSKGTDDVVGAVAGSTIPVKFRIEQGTVGRLEISPLEATIKVGETQQYSATVFDLHDQPLLAAVSWTSANETVATVNGSGLASGLVAGSTTITATSSGISAAASLTVEVSAPPLVWLFSTCGATGMNGPAQAQCDDAYAESVLSGTQITAGIQSWVVPVSGTYRITAVGARGASGDLEYLGGRGAQVTGDFALVAGQVIQIAVGQRGLGQGIGQNGGGGGGSFVVATGSSPLLVAGGGGGTRANAQQDGCDASIVEFGVIGSGFSPLSTCAVKSTGLGQGGLVSENSWGSGGGGFYGNGAGDPGNGTGGGSWANLLVGGASLGCGGGGGGFGGGGAGAGCWGGGGGGGYSGGDGGFIAGGGGSFNAGSNPSAVAGVGVADGSVRIERL